MNADRDSLPLPARIRRAVTGWLGDLRARRAGALRPELAARQRFENVSAGYPGIVSTAYVGDNAQALADDPATVAARVVKWERTVGIEPRDWSAIGRDEGATGVDPGPPKRSPR